ncbi:MAG: SCO6745 family protein [Microbacterium sp.]
MIDDQLLSRRARTLGAIIEPVTGQVYFSPECHRAYESLGFGPSPIELGGVAMPDGVAYFASRGSVLGQVPGEVVAATFGVFNPAVVIPMVAQAWTITTAEVIGAARTEGAVGQLVRVLGATPDGLARATALLEQANEGLRPEGRPLFAGMVSLGLPGDPMGDMWRLADRLREYRGDAHIAAWSSAGFDATEIGLLTELYWGLPMRTYIRTRSWSDTDLDAAEARLVERGLVSDGAFTSEGRAAREQVEMVTDRLCRPIIGALGDDFDELIALVGPWGESVKAAGGYPGAGPHDLSGQAADAS